MTAEVLTAPDDFSARAAPLRRELLAHAYRMLGSPDEAEDVVQESYLRAWRSYRGFEGRSSLRVWLYRIVTNASLTALRGRGRRALPSGLSGPSDDPLADVADAPGVAWLEPMADALVTPESDDPAVIATARDGLRLALLAGLQELPPRQRAVLILREVLDVPAAEVATMLDTTVAAVKSSLQRARGPGWPRRRRGPGGQRSRPNRRPGPCWSCTWRPSRTPIWARWNGRCGPTRASRWSAPAPGSPGAGPAWPTWPGCSASPATGG